MRDVKSYDVLHASGLSDQLHDLSKQSDSNVTASGRTAFVLSLPKRYVSKFFRILVVPAVPIIAILVLIVSPILFNGPASTILFNTPTATEPGAFHSAEAAGSFQDTEFVGGLNTPTTIEFSPDGRLFVAEKAGKLMVIKNGALLGTPFLSVSVNSSGERGLLGIAFDPDFATNRFVYVYYTTSSTPIHNRVSRFTADLANPDRALPGSELTLLDLENLSSATNHNGGAIHFGKDGKLYIAVGENANSANSQSLSTRLGKILRINSDGTIPSDNPFFNTAGAKKEIWALGLRNPFTFTFSPAPTSTLMYINDVGANNWEEINSGARGANYGWPTCEGTCTNANFVNPVYVYAHAGSGKAIAGAAFYESAQFPAEYKGSYFFGDYVAGFIKRMTPSNQVVAFLPIAPSPVDIKIGPDGSLYYLSIGNEEVHKVQYISGGNSNPVAMATGNPASGQKPLAVTFDGSGSSDPDPDVLAYSWDFGDGSSVEVGVTRTHTYSNAGQYIAKLTVSDGKGGTGMASVNIAVGNPPVGQIDTPVVNTKFNAGNIISFSGSGTDIEDGTLASSAFSWKILLHHNTHTHPVQEFTSVKSSSFTIPRVGESSDDVWYRIYLTVKDSSGLSQLSTRDVLPNKATITLGSNVNGLQVSLDGQPQTTPYSFVGVVGFTRTLQAPAQQNLGGETYQFQSWSDGGAATHTINTPASTTAYTANYEKTTIDTIEPTVAITSPSNNAVISGPSSGVSVPISGTASDLSGIMKVIVKVDSGTYATVIPATPGDYSQWTISHIIKTAGTHTITAKAYDNAGNYQWHTLSVKISFNDVSQDTIQPTVAITSPSNGATLSGPSSGVSINVAGSASDSGSGIKNVLVRVDTGAYLDVTPSSPNNYSSWTRSLTISTSGLHTITVKANDNAGNSQWHTINVNISFTS